MSFTVSTPRIQNNATKWMLVPSHTRCLVKVFRLKVCLGKDTWRVFKTYTDFKELHAQVSLFFQERDLRLFLTLLLFLQLKGTTRKVKRKVSLPKLPGNKMFGADKEHFVKKRKQKLQQYVNELLKVPEVMKSTVFTGTSAFYLS